MSFNHFISLQLFLIAKTLCNHVIICICPFIGFDEFDDAEPSSREDAVVSYALGRLQVFFIAEFSKTSCNRMHMLFCRA